MDFSFGSLLKQLRAENGLSQTALAEKLFISQDTVSLWECDKSLPDFNSIKKLAEIFEVSADYLLGLRDY
jgi:transcriptional regulator with XRE-family HTH domain